MTSLPDVLAKQLLEQHDAPRITVLQRLGGNRDLSGPDLHAAAVSMLAQWRGWFGKGPHTFVLALPPGEIFLSALLAGLLGGHTVVPVAPPRGGSQSSHLRHIVRDCGASAVLCTQTLRHAIDRCLATGDPADPVCPVVSLDDPSQDPSPSAQIPPDATADTRPAIIQYTSGSTRHPKGVLIFGEQILANSDLVARSWDMNASTRFVNWLPHYHDMGLMGGILYPLLTGAWSAQMSPLDVVRDPASWLRAVCDHRATFSGGPAFAFADCLRRITPEQCEGLDLSSWNRAFCGAEPIPAGLLPAFRTRFAPYGLRPDAVFGCYGMAEMTLFAAGAPETGRTLPLPPPGCSAVHPCLLADTTRDGIRIVDPASRGIVPDGQPGEIWLRGPSRGAGYVNMPEETVATFHAALAEPGQSAGDAYVQNDWLRTGDLGVISDDLLYVTGRSKDMLIAQGRNVSAPELEWLAASLDDALNPLAAAAFMPDHTASGTGVLFIELKPGRTAPKRPETVCAAIERAVLGEWGIRLQAVRILRRGRLERTSSGKIRRQTIADAYRAGRLPQSYDETPATAAKPETAGIP